MLKQYSIKTSLSFSKTRSQMSPGHSSMTVASKDPQHDMKPKKEVMKQSPTIQTSVNSSGNTCAMCTMFSTTSAVQVPPFPLKSCLLQYPRSSYWGTSVTTKATSPTTQKSQKYETGLPARSSQTSRHSSASGSRIIPPLLTPSSTSHAKAHLSFGRKNMKTLCKPSKMLSCTPLL